MKIFAQHGGCKPGSYQTPFRIGARVAFPSGGMRRSFALVAALALMLVAPEIARAQNAAPDTKTNSAPAGNAENGKKIFASHPCSTCHGSEGQGATGPQIGPPPLALSAFIRYIRQPVGLMPPFGSEAVSDAELSDVYAFLKSVTPSETASAATPAGNADNGKKLFINNGCYECHGYEGQGAQQTGGATIGPPPLPFTAFAKYVHQPTGSMPPYTAKVLSDVQLADIYAYLKTIPQPPSPKSIPLLNQ